MKDQLKTKTNITSKYKIRFVAILLLALFNIKNADSQLRSTNPEHIIIPKGYQVLAEKKGDLDKDGIPELVIVFNTPKEIDFGTERQIWIYKKVGMAWKLWHKSTGAVLPSQHGGMMGDPFDGIEIDHGVLVIDHWGGSAIKWFYTHRYRYQNNNFYLIGTYIRWGRLPDELNTFDYNLSTGEIIANIDKNLEGDTPIEAQSITFYNKPKTLVLMDGFKTGENEVKVPKNESFYY